MSTPTGIAATTLAIRTLLQTSLPTGTGVTTLTLARAGQLGGKRGTARLNLCLWKVALGNPSQKNLLPRPSPTVTQTSPLHVELHYLITAYGTSETSSADSVERLLAAALQTIQQHPMLVLPELSSAPGGSSSRTPQQVQLILESLPIFWPPRRKCGQR
jgi:hypothetical protein